jgi:hypothetical protein
MAALRLSNRRVIDCLKEDISRNDAAPQRAIDFLDSGCISEVSMRCSYGTRVSLPVKIT